MAECDERRWLAALSLMNSGMEADDASNKTFVAVMCPETGFWDKCLESRIFTKFPQSRGPGAGQVTGNPVFKEFSSTGPSCGCEHPNS
jgi:hypothetical protein